MPTTYIATEPDEVHAFADNRGGLHYTREEAIGATFDNDFRRAVAEMIKNDSDGFDDMPGLQTLKFVRFFVQKNPDLVRVLLGMRDATG